MYVQVIFKSGNRPYTYHLADGVKAPDVGAVIRMTDAVSGAKVAYGTRVVVTNILAVSDGKPVTNIAWTPDAIDVENVSSYAKDKEYIVFRTVKGVHYFWGAWDNLNEALAAADDIGGRVVRRDHMRIASEGWL